MKKISIRFNFLQLISLLFIFASLNSYAFTNGCPNDNSGTLFAQFINEKKLLEYWKQKLEKFYTAVPNLSPKEDKWLNDEINAGGERLARVSTSNEFAIRVVKNDIGNALFVMQNKLNSTSKMSQIVAWNEFLYHLTWRNDLAIYIDMLIRSGTIKVNDLPPSWNIIGDTYAEKINFGKTLLSSNVLGCIIPRIAE